MNVEQFYRDRQKQRDNSIDYTVEMRRYKKIVEMAELIGGMRILDVGCAQGILRDCLPHDVEYVGIDLIPRTSTMISADVSKRIPLADKSIDVVFALEIIEHLVAPYAFLQEVRRIFRNNGLLVLSVPNPYHWKEIVWNLFGVSDRSGHIYSWTRQTILQLGTFAGLKLVRVSPWPACIFGGFSRSIVYLFKEEKQ